jgi:tape measure domain-containing protein
MNNVEKYIIQLQDKFSATMTKIEASSKRLDSSMMNVRKSVLSLQGAMAGVGFGLFARNVVMTAAKMEGLRNAIDFASGGGQQGIDTLKMLENTSNKLGVSLEATMEGYKTFSASVMGTGLSIEQSQKAFNDVSVGISAMGLTAEKSKLIFMALGQMMSKGKVSSEELRLQLGESLPGALNIAAKSMGLTTAEFNKMMEKGEVISKDFLPSFAAEIANTFGGLLPKSTQSLQSNINRLSNTFLTLKETIGTNLYPQISKLISITSTLMDKFIQLIKWTSENKATIKAMAIVISVLMIPTIVALIIKLNLLSVAFGVLSRAMLMNPFTALAVAIGAVVVAMVHLWNNSVKFKSFFFAIGAVVGNLSKRLENLGQRMMNFFYQSTGQFGKVKKIEKVGESIGEAWARGIQNGQAAFAKSKMKGYNPALNFNQGTAGVAGTTDGSGTAEAAAAESQPTSITGSAPKVFNINVDKLIDGFTITTNNLTESATAIKEHVTRALAEALSDIQTVAS